MPCQSSAASMPDVTLRLRPAFVVVGAVLFALAVLRLLALSALQLLVGLSLTAARVVRT
ncbi:hypothetical protein [Streptomyces sp. NPDC018000]|uniref:hypothetical protein n=1 Tax=Streptomyces sp. NPDC018000 TaxID=3365028 RepID=UPI0037AE94FC